MTKEMWLEKNGFSPDGFTYSVWGDDTYSIKEWLKEQGFKFSPLLKWHSPVPVDVPVGYGLICFAFDELYKWEEENKNAYYFEKAEMLISKRFKEAEGPSLSEYMGEIGERFRALSAVFKSSRGFSGMYGWTYIHTFQIGHNVLVWFTQKELDLEKGQPILLSGTVKKHEEFREVKTTQLSRCIIKVVE